MTEPSLEVGPLTAFSNSSRSVFRLRACAQGHHCSLSSQVQLLPAGAGPRRLTVQKGSQLLTTVPRTGVAAMLSEMNAGHYSSPVLI